MKIVINNGRIIDPQHQIDKLGALYVSDSKISGILNTPDGFIADIQIDATGLIVCPGFIDLSTHLREPGQTHKATLLSETRSAASAGYTSLCIPPDTKPIIDTTAVVELIKDKAERCGYPQVYPIAALTQKLAGKELSSLYALKKAGCIAVSQAQFAMQDLLVLRRAMEYAATHDLLLMYCPEEHALSNHGCAHEGAMASQYGLPGIPVVAESIAVMQCIELVGQTGCRVHFRGLSCARSVDLIAKAKEINLPISADVAMHHLHLADQDMRPYDSHYHVLPPLRSEQDRQALIAGIQDGTVDCICSDHQPHDIDAKLGAFPETEPGMATLETMLPLMLALTQQEGWSLGAGIAKLSSEPAKVLGLPAGKIGIGDPADICIFDPTLSWQVDEQTWLSQGRNTPFWQQTMLGKVNYTIQAGKLIYSAEI